MSDYACAECVRQRNSMTAEVERLTRERDEARGTYAKNLAEFNDLWGLHQRLAGERNALAARLGEAEGLLRSCQNIGEIRFKTNVFASQVADEIAAFLAAVPKAKEGT